MNIKIKINPRYSADDVKALMSAIKIFRTMKEYEVVKLIIQVLESGKTKLSLYKKVDGDIVPVYRSEKTEFVLLNYYFSFVEYGHYHFITEEERRHKMLTIAKSIKKMRLSLKLSQRQLAESLGCHLSYISRIEKGRVNMSIIKLEALLNAMDCTLHFAIAPRNVGNHSQTK